MSATAADRAEQPVVAATDNGAHLMPPPPPIELMGAAGPSAATAAAAALLQSAHSAAALGRAGPTASTSSLQTDNNDSSSRKRSREAASPAVGREDAAAWASAMARVRRSWPDFNADLESRIAKVRSTVRQSGKTAGCQDVYYQLEDGTWMRSIKQLAEALLPRTAAAGAAGPATPAQAAAAIRVDDIAGLAAPTSSAAAGAAANPAAAAAAATPSPSAGGNSSRKPNRPPITRDDPERWQRLVASLQRLWPGITDQQMDLIAAARVSIRTKGPAEGRQEWRYQLAGSDSWIRSVATLRQQIQQLSSPPLDAFPGEPIAVAEDDDRPSTRQRLQNPEDQQAAAAAGEPDSEATVSEARDPEDAAAATAASVAAASEGALAGVLEPPAGYAGLRAALIPVDPTFYQHLQQQQQQQRRQQQQRHLGQRHQQQCEGDSPHEQQHLDLQQLQQQDRHPGEELEWLQEPPPVEQAGHSHHQQAHELDQGQEHHIARKPQQQLKQQRQERQEHAAHSPGTALHQQQQQQHLQPGEEQQHQEQNTQQQLEGAQGVPPQQQQRQRRQQGPEEIGQRQGTQHTNGQAAMQQQRRQEQQQPQEQEAPGPRDQSGQHEVAEPAADVAGSKQNLSPAACAAAPAAKVAAWGTESPASDSTAAAGGTFAGKAANIAPSGLGLEAAAVETPKVPAGEAGSSHQQHAFAAEDGRTARGDAPVSISRDRQAEAGANLRNSEMGLASTAAGALAAQSQQQGEPATADGPGAHWHDLEQEYTDLLATLGNETPRRQQQQQQQQQDECSPATAGLQGLLSDQPSHLELSSGEQQSQEQESHHQQQQQQGSHQDDEELQAMELQQRGQQQQQMHLPADPAAGEDDSRQELRTRRNGNKPREQRREVSPVAPAKRPLTFEERQRLRQQQLLNGNSTEPQDAVLQQQQNGMKRDAQPEASDGEGHRLGQVQRHQKAGPAGPANSSSGVMGSEKPDRMRSSSREKNREHTRERSARKERGSEHGREYSSRRESSKERNRDHSSKKSKNRPNSRKRKRDRERDNIRSSKAAGAAVSGAASPTDMALPSRTANKHKRDRSEERGGAPASQSRGQHQQFEQARRPPAAIQAGMEVTPPSAEQEFIFLRTEHQRLLQAEQRSQQQLIDQRQQMEQLRQQMQQQRGQLAQQQQQLEQQGRENEMLRQQLQEVRQLQGLLALLAEPQLEQYCPPGFVEELQRQQQRPGQQQWAPQEQQHQQQQQQQGRWQIGGTFNVR